MSVIADAEAPTPIHVRLHRSVMECVRLQTVTDVFIEVYDAGSTLAFHEKDVKVKKVIVEALAHVAIRHKLFARYSHHAAAVLKEREVRDLFMREVVNTLYAEFSEATLLDSMLHHGNDDARIELAAPLLRTVLSYDEEALDDDPHAMQFLHIVTAAIVGRMKLDQVLPLTQTLAYWLDYTTEGCDVVARMLKREPTLALFSARLRVALVTIVSHCAQHEALWVAAVGCCVSLMYAERDHSEFLPALWAMFSSSISTPEADIVDLGNSLCALAALCQDGSRLIANSQTRLKSICDTLLYRDTARMFAVVEYVLPVCPDAQLVLNTPHILRALTRRLARLDLDIEEVDFTLSALYALVAFGDGGLTAVSEGVENAWIAAAQTHIVHDDPDQYRGGWVYQGRLDRRILPATMLLLLAALVPALPVDSVLRAPCDAVKRVVAICDEMIRDPADGYGVYAGHTARNGVKKLPDESKNLSVLQDAAHVVHAWFST